MPWVGLPSNKVKPGAPEFAQAVSFPSEWGFCEIPQPQPYRWERRMAYSIVGILRSLLPRAFHWTPGKTPSFLTTPKLCLFILLPQDLCPYIISLSSIKFEWSFVFSQFRFSGLFSVYASDSLLRLKFMYTTADLTAPLDITGICSSARLELGLPP